MIRGKHRNHSKSSAHYKWREGGVVASNGYMKMRLGKNHPLSDPNGWAYEHLVIWVSAGNSRPGKGMILHHLNECKTDNRIENLQLMSRAEHNKLHNKEKIRCKQSGQFVAPNSAGREWNEMPEVRDV